MDFVCLSHLLEHVPTAEAAAAFVRTAATVSRNFILIRQPFFDSDRQLADQGLKLYWSDWSGHPNHMTSGEFLEVVRKLERDGLIEDYSIYYKGPIATNAHSTVHPLSSPTDQHHYDEAKHPTKPEDIVLEDVFHEIHVLLVIEGDGNEYFEKLALHQYAYGRKREDLRTRGSNSARKRMAKRARRLVGSLKDVACRILPQS